MTSTERQGFLIELSYRYPIDSGRNGTNAKMVAVMELHKKDKRADRHDESSAIWKEKEAGVRD